MDNKKLIKKLVGAQEAIKDCIDELSREGKIKLPEHFSLPSDRKISPKKIDFSLNSRNFFKKYTKKLSGPKKFVVATAFLAKGKFDADISYEVIERLWKKHKTILGSMANNYGTRAKESGWLDSKKYATYHLTNKWEDIFDSSEK